MPDHDPIDALAAAPIIRLGESFEEFKERYTKWYREARNPAVDAPRTHTVPPARFVVARRQDSKDIEDVACSFYPVTSASPSGATGDVPIAYVASHDPLDNARATRVAQMVAEALTEYADRHGLGDAAFRTGWA